MNGIEYRKLRFVVNTMLIYTKYKGNKASTHTGELTDAILKLEKYIPYDKLNYRTLLYYNLAIANILDDFTYGRDINIQQEFKDVQTLVDFYKGMGGE